MSVRALVIAAASLVLATAVSANAQGKPNSELAAMVKKAIQLEKKALKDFKDTGPNNETKTDLKESQNELKGAEPSTSGTTGADLRQAINKDEIAIDNAGARNPNDRSRARAKINEAILKKEAALLQLEPKTATAPPPENAAPVVKPIHAVFDEELRQTNYFANATDADGDKLTYKWSLDLTKLVDPAGSSPAGSPDAHAALDPTCNQADVAEDNANQVIPDEFVWQHADPPVNQCDHMKMGPSGHQGTVTVVVTDGHWSCEAIYKGTNSGDGPTPPPCKKL
jgi:hypothetical protein